MEVVVSGLKMDEEYGEWWWKVLRVFVGYGCGNGTCLECPVGIVSEMS